MNSKRLYAIRGATGCSNSEQSICDCVCSMCGSIFTDNNLSARDIVSIQFTMTDDLDALNPATALRRGNVPIDTSSIPLFCSQEPRIKGMKPLMIRVLVTAYMEEGAVVRPCYINGAQSLRPDLAAKGDNQ